ncbi:MAG: sodium:proton antiporter NhaD, partial [Candidatus Sericytochromatia bacterium]
MIHRLFAALFGFLPLWLTLPVLAVAEGDPPVRPPTHEVVQALDLTSSWIGFTAIGIFLIGYALVIAEEFLHLKKSKPMMVAAGLIWVLIGFGYAQVGDSHTAHEAVLHNIMEFGELFLFLLAAMTFVNTIEERGVFDLLRARLTGAGFSYRALFWVTGACA